jgi:hypothetical protein
MIHNLLVSIMKQNLLKYFINIFFKKIKMKLIIIFKSTIIYNLKIIINYV